MKKINFKAVLFFSVFGILLLGIGCHPETLLDGVNINIGTQVLYNPLNIEVVDARLELGKIPENATLSIEGKDKDKIYSVFGEKAITINNVSGIANLAIPRSIHPTADNPLLITAVIKAPGYIDTRKNFEITGDTVSNFEIVRMVSLDQPPTGVTIKNTVISVDAAKGVMQDVSFNTPTADAKTENAFVTVKAGTKMFDTDGNPVSGSINVSLIHYDAKNETSINCMPGGLSFRGARNMAGENIGDDDFTTLGFINMSMEAGGKQIKTFSQPLDMAIEINPDIFLPLQQRNVQAGDTIPVWSLNETDNTWQGETIAIVSQKNGKLVASYQQKHLSIWNLDWFNCPYVWNNFFKRFSASPSCKCNNVGYIKIISDFNNYSTSSRFFLTISIVENPNQIFHTISDPLLNNNFIYLFNFPINKKFKINIFDRERWNGGKLIYTTPAFIPVCGGITNLDLRGKLPKPAPEASPVPILLNFSGICSGKTASSAKAVITPTVTVYFREINKDYFWRVLGSIYNGSGYCNQLIPGHVYEFGVFHGSLSRTTRDLGLPNGFTMPQGDTTIVFNSKTLNLTESFNIHKTNSGYILNYINFPIPDKLCAEYKKYF